MLGSGQSHTQPVVHLEEADVIIRVGSHQRQKNDVIFFTFVKEVLEYILVILLLLLLLWMAPSEVAFLGLAQVISYLGISFQGWSEKFLDTKKCDYFFQPPHQF